MATDTIAAPATPPGRGGVAILRVSGPQVRKIAEAILGACPSPRVACVSSFRDEQGEVLDQGLALFFSGPQSFTGEDVLELQGHGGPVIVNLLLKRILSLGARLARPGEFSERAFLNGKMDLAQAEAVADLIQASTEAAARSALRSLQGEFSRQIESLVEALIEVRTYIEAAIDFAEEEIDFLSQESLHQRFEQIFQRLGTLEKAAQQGSLLREGLNLVLIGKPNTGKSSLLNALSGKELAIVTDFPGTTRDTLREQIQIEGLPLHLIDTAGLRETEDPIEKEGIRRSHLAMQQADLLLYLTDARETASIQDLVSSLMQNYTGTAFPAFIHVRNKIDLTSEKPRLREEDQGTTVSVSAKTGEGLDLLKTAIKTIAGYSFQQEGCFSARQRHLDALKKAQDFLSNAFQQLKTTRAAELIAEELRLAQTHLNEITGEFSNEDLLGRIFSSFCIGK